MLLICTKREAKKKNFEYPTYIQTSKLFQAFIKYNEVRL